ncbi:MAG: glutamate synthase-related protein [Wenzhouxiangella sp.]|nr:glutamate synthase-related protein [Wenzhouxiangella sp.]
MSDRVIADNQPIEVTLKQGQKIAWCTCGRSKDQPYCDGSHRGTEFTPLMFTPPADETAWLCQCKHTQNPPYCDGSHKQFSDDQVGQSVGDDDKSGDDEGSDDDSNDEEGMPTAEPTPEEPQVALIHQMAREDLKTFGQHGPMVAMGVPRDQLPHWDDIQILTAQLHARPLEEDADVETQLVIGPEAKKPLVMAMPLFVSDMSFGALSPEAKIALARGAEMAGTGICSGEGGMLAEEQAENSRYLFELASAKFGWDETIPDKVQAFHFKGGQAAKTGTGGHLPGIKNTQAIAKVRGLTPGEDAISPAAFEDLKTPKDFKRFADRVREISGGIPIGFKLSANHIEKDIQFALDASADYLILDGRGGATGAAPAMFRDHISVPTLPALARARRYLDKQNASGRVTLIITGGLRLPMDCVKAMALGADGVALANAAIQAVGCVGARICHTNNCPSGIATQREDLRARINVQQSALQLAQFLATSTHLMQVMARACGHQQLSAFSRDDLTTWHHSVAELTGIQFAGLG